MLFFQGQVKNFLFNCFYTHQFIILLRHCAKIMKLWLFLGFFLRKIFLYYHFLWLDTCGKCAVVFVYEMTVTNLLYRINIYVALCHLTTKNFVCGHHVFLGYVVRSKAADV
jgi:hypothetical protein